jgi:hypothetical protein
MRTDHGSSEVPLEDAKTSTGVLSGAVATVYVAPGVRVVDDGIQWIVQRHIGSRWRGQSYHRSRRVLIERLGESTSELEALPEFHLRSQSTDWPRCHVCGRIKSKPTSGLPPHLFCVRKRWGGVCGNSFAFGESIRKQILAQQHLPNPITINLPDEKATRAWLATGKDGKNIVGDALLWGVNCAGHTPSVLYSPETISAEQSSKHGALQSDDYKLEYYEDGYPKLPACLDRRRAA